MILKTMSDENIPDSSTHKGFFILDNVAVAEFMRRPIGETYPGKEMPKETPTQPVIQVTFKDGTDRPVYPSGNSYLMNDEGKTIQCFAFSEYIKD